MLLLCSLLKSSTDWRRESYSARIVSIPIQLITSERALLSLPSRAPFNIFIVYPTHSSKRFLGITVAAELFSACPNHIIFISIFIYQLGVQKLEGQQGNYSDNCRILMDVLLHLIIYKTLLLFSLPSSTGFGTLRLAPFLFEPSWVLTSLFLCFCIFLFRGADPAGETS